MVGAPRAQTLGVAVAHVSAGQQAHHRHAGGDPGGHARLAVLDHQGASGIDAHGLSRVQEQVGVRLAALDLQAGEDGVVEPVDQAEQR